MSYDQCSTSKAPKNCFVHPSPCNPCFLTSMPSTYIPLNILSLNLIKSYPSSKSLLIYSSSLVLSCRQMEMHPHNLWSVCFWLEYQRFPWPHLGQWLPRTAHRNELVIIFIPMVYYSERTLSKVSKGKRHIRWSPRELGAEFQIFTSWLPGESHKMCLIPVVVYVLVTDKCYLPGRLNRDPAPTFTGGWSCRYSLSSMYSNPRPPIMKAGL